MRNNYIMILALRFPINISYIYIAIGYIVINAAFQFHCPYLENFETGTEMANLSAKPESESEDRDRRPAAAAKHATQKRGSNEMTCLA